MIKSAQGTQDELMEVLKELFVIQTAPNKEKTEIVTLNPKLNDESLNKIIDNYYIYKAKLEDYPFSAQTMCEEFLEQFIEVKNKKPSKEPEINKIIMFIFLFKNNVQKLFTSLNIKQYFKKLIKIWSIYKI